MRSYFPSVSFDCIQTGHTISKRGTALSLDDAARLTQVGSAPAAVHCCRLLWGCSRGTSFACFWQSLCKGYSPGAAAANLKWKYQQQKGSLRTGHEHHNSSIVQHSAAQMQKEGCARASRVVQKYSGDTMLAPVNRKSNQDVNWTASIFSNAQLKINSLNRGELS